jgi:hypothetical protein
VGIARPTGTRTAAVSPLLALLLLLLLLLLLVCLLVLAPLLMLLLLLAAVLVHQREVLIFVMCCFRNQRGRCGSQCWRTSNAAGGCVALPINDSNDTQRAFDLVPAILSSRFSSSGSGCFC